MIHMVKPHYRIKKDELNIKPQVLSEHHKIYHFQDENERNKLEIFSVFSGIELIYNKFSSNDCKYELEVTGNILEINYCHEGREECQWICGHYLYLGKGDLSITQMENGAPSLYFPSKHYVGITVVLDLDLLKNQPLPLLEHSSLNLEDFLDKFCPNHHFFAIRANEQVSHIFEELYKVPTKIQADYFKIKILELLLCLSLIEPDKELHIKQIAKNQIDIMEQVKKYLTTNLQTNITIAELSKEFCISATSLKTNFKLIYNMTIKEYVRSERMKKAAFLLCESNQTVSEIATQLGYKNQSKFSSAFKERYGLTPLTYRKKTI